ncbi:MAG: hypothetical protein ACOX8E_06995 [Ruminococcus sp.]|jgi:hypothetical protein
MSIESDKSALLCRSEKGETRTLFFSLAVTLAIVLAFQAMVFLNGIFHPLQIGILCIFIGVFLYYCIKIRKDCKNWLNLYNQYYEISEGKFPYSTIRRCSSLKGQLILKTDKKRTFYVKNAEELEKILQTQILKSKRKGREC